MGRITREQFDAALKDLMVQDAQGRWWMLGAESGKWYTHDGKNWVEAQPPTSSARAPTAPAVAQPAPQPPTAQVAAPPPAAKPSSRIGKVLITAAAALVLHCLCLCVVSVMLSGDPVKSWQLRVSNNWS